MTASTPTASEKSSPARGNPAWQAFALLRTIFTVAPIVFGLDKFFNLLVDWPGYVSPIVTDALLLTAQQFMYVVGVIEIVAGLTVALVPRFGSLLVAAWLAVIILNLLLVPGFYDVALRDFGLLVAALALFRLSSIQGRRATPIEHV